VSGKLQSVNVMEINPILDNCNRTAQVAVSLLASLFGKTIL
jgi:arginase